jgi:ketosteroid isomerase-like protein
MSSRETNERAQNPEDLARFFVERVNAGDVDGLVALYEPEAILVGPQGQVMKGAKAIRGFYSALLKSRPTFQPGDQRPALQNGGLALTSSRLTNGIVTAGVAREQPGGSWRWVIDQPAIARETA